MTRRWPALGAAALGLAVCVGLSACGDDDTRPPPRPSGTVSATSTSGGGDGGAGGAGGAGGGAQGGGGGARACGNGAMDPGEECDGADFGVKDCPFYGFDDGQPICTADCVVDTSTCSGVEQCQDGKNNDGDEVVDCDDPDCAAACADPCAAPQVLPDPVLATGQTEGHAPLTEPTSCTDPGGPAVVYAVTATMTGFLDIGQLTTSDADLAVSVRTSCASSATEIACANDYAGMFSSETISIPIAAGETVFVIVSGSDATQVGSFDLSIQSRETACGDGVQDPTEECDDLNTTPGDGCSAQCLVEATEVEPNNTVATANAFAAPFYATIGPAGDEDFVAITIPSGPSTLTVGTGDFGAECSRDDLDSYLEIFDASGMTLLGSDDDSGIGLCALATVSGLPADTVLVRVRSALGTSMPTFAYRLEVTVTPDL